MAGEEAEAAPLLGAALALARGTDNPRAEIEVLVGLATARQYLGARLGAAVVRAGADDPKNTGKHAFHRVDADGTGRIAQRKVRGNRSNDRKSCGKNIFTASRR